MRGAGHGQFRFPRGIALDRFGYVYVADAINNRIQKFTRDGTFVTKWGSWGSMDGQFDVPRYVAIDESGYVYMTDDHNNRIQKFGPDITQSLNKK